MGEATAKVVARFCHQPPPVEVSKRWVKDATDDPMHPAVKDILEAFKRGDVGGQLCTTCTCASTGCKCTSSPPPTGMLIGPSQSHCR